MLSFMATRPVTEYFGDRAAEYARFRPSYAPDAIASVLEGAPPGSVVVDVGAGTGIASRQLQAAGAQVIGVEPNAAMRAQAEAAGGGPRYVEGLAEASGLPSGVAQRAVCAQCFHWLDPVRALPELHRLLAPGGRLALLYNVRQETTPFMRAYAEIGRQTKVSARAAGRRAPDHRSELGSNRWFGAERRLTFAHDERLTWEEVAGRRVTASHFPREAAEAAALLASLRAAFEQEATPGADGAPRVLYAQVTLVTLADRLA